MEMTDYAIQKSLVGEMPYKQHLDGDLRITIREIKGKKQKRTILDLHLIEKETGQALFVIATNVAVEEGGIVMVESPSGLMSIPVNMKSDSHG